jgi:hypothetical protein
MESTAVAKLHTYERTILFELSEWPIPLEDRSWNFQVALSFRLGVALRALTYQGNRRPAAGAKRCRRGVRVDRWVRRHGRI